MSGKRGRSQAEVGAEPQTKRILSAAASHSRNVAAIIIGITNPEYVQLGLRFRDPYNSEDTATYYSWDKPQASEVFPQEVVTGLLLADNTTVPIPNDHGAVNQYTQFLFHSLMRRWIQEDKNPQKRFTLYQWFGTDGRVDFEVDSSDVLTDMTDIKVGGAKYNEQILSTSAGTLTGSANPFATASPDFDVSRLTFKAMHEQKMAPGVFRGDTYLYNDGCSLASQGTGASAAKVYVAGYAGSGNFGTPTAAGASSVARNLCGSLNIAHGAVPLLAGTRFAVKIIGYNEGAPYELLNTSVTGTVAATPLVDQVIFSYPIALPDSYRVQFSCMATGNTQPAGASIRIWQINTGEMWRQRHTPGAESNFSSIKAHRGFGTTLLSTNDTPELTKGGRAVTAQLPFGDDWMTVQDSGDQFSYVTRQLREKDKPFVRGHFSWLRLGDVKETMQLCQEVIPVPASERDAASIGGAAASVEPFVFQYNLRAAVLVQSVNAPTANKQTIQFTIATNGEYSTGNQWQHDGQSPYTYVETVTLTEPVVLVLETKLPADLLFLHSD